MPSWPGGYGLEALWPHAANFLSGPIQADIVFVHGLNGDPASTWSCNGPNGKRISWLSDNGFLPSAIPLSRIFTFKYNARIINYNSDATLEDIARSLLSQVENVRSKELNVNQKVIFVCHSLGGLVVKQALVLKTDNESLRAIQDQTAGIIFLGTPHGGSHLGVSLARIAFFTGSSKDLSKVLSINSDSLNKLSAEFEEYYMKRLKGEIRAAPVLKVRSFAEMHRTCIAHTPIGAKVVPIKSSQLNLPDEIVTPVEKDHHTICRFESQYDPVFIMIWRQLSHWMAQPSSEIRPRGLSLERIESYTRAQYYEVPIQTDNFVGRADDLRTLEQELILRGHGSYESVGLYGSGGIGKTQLAIQYASMHKNEYGTVKFFDARSEKDLRASVEKFFDFLIQKNDERLLKSSGKDCKDKCAAVMNWFQDEKKWLIVYDDADFDPPYDPRNYFPRHATGHLILIGRGPTVSQYAKSAMELLRMSRPDAIRMLLSHSKPPAYSTTEIDQEQKETADQIADELDDIPGFIEVAAKYILHNRPTLKEYLLMLRNKKQNMRLDSEKGVLGDAFASWELALNKLQTKPSSILLLRLFAFLDGSNIHGALRSKIISPCKRWDTNGEEVKRSPEWSGIDEEIVNLFRDGEAFDAAVTPLLDASFVRRQNSGSASRIEILQTIQQFVQWNMAPAERLEWTKKVICIVSHVLVEEPSQDANSEAIRIAMTPHVFRCVDHSRNFKVEQFQDALPNVLPQFISMLILSLAKSGMELDYVDELVKGKDDGYYRCLAAKWRGYNLFYANHKRAAEQWLARVQASEEQLAATNGKPENPRAHAALGDLIMHRAQFLFNEGRYEESEEAIKSWAPISDSAYEKRIKRNLDIALDKTQVASGHIDLAINHLEEVVTQGRPRSISENLLQADVNWATVILCQVYCFQGRYRAALSQLRTRVDALLASKLQAEFITSDFRIIMCEALMGLGKFMDAERELAQLCDDLRLPTQVVNKRAPSQLFSAMCMRARCFHLQKQWIKAEAAWIAALEHEQITEVKLWQPDFETKSYNFLVAIYSLAVVCLHLGDKERAQRYKSVAEADRTALEFPKGKTNYTRWLSRVEEEYVEMASAKKKGDIFHKFLFWTRVVS